MKLISERQITMSGVTHDPGEPFECSDEIARVLIRKNSHIRRSEPPKVLYAIDGPNARPDVTCLCVTRNRPQWLSKAIVDFRAQTFPSIELLIVADGESVRDLLPFDQTIRLIHIEEGYNIGQKRNFGCENARGNIIVHWDDDDHSEPLRVEDQVTRLRASGLAVTGYSTMPFTDGKDWWMFDGACCRAFGSSLCYKKSWWKANQFPALQVGEDGAFVKKAQEAKQLSSVGSEMLMYATIHPDNTSQRNVDNDPWRPMPGFAWAGR